MWGSTLSIDCYGVDKILITSRGAIKKYVIELCDLIKMNRHGRTIIEYFGREQHLKGYSLMQLIETSSIVGHFADEDRAAFIDIFSCKEFDAEVAAKFTAKFFKARRFDVNVLSRGDNNEM